MMDVVPIPAFVPLSALASHTGQAHSVLNRKARAGLLPAVKVNGKWLVPVSYLAQLERDAYARCERQAS